MINSWVNIESDTSHDLSNQSYLNLLFETEFADSAKPIISSLLDLINSGTARISLVDENYINERRLLSLRKDFTSKLINLIMESDFEYGIDSPADEFIRNRMKENSIVTKHWLNEIFTMFYGNPVIITGILHIISRLPFYEISPEGQIIALSALSHANTEVQECGIRAFESWGTLNSLHILSNVNIATPWLQDYITTVIEDLSIEHNVSVS